VCAGFLRLFIWSRVSGTMRFRDESDIKFCAILEMIRQEFGEESLSRTRKVQTHRDQTRRDR
jgi:hypothetical protein